jgi:DNA-binding NarL/FixJ family response regulator
VDADLSARLSAAQRARGLDEGRRRQREAMLRLWADPDYRAAQAEARRSGRTARETLTPEQAAVALRMARRGRGVGQVADRLGVSRHRVLAWAWVELGRQLSRNP